jgi:hypothetical protein
MKLADHSAGSRTASTEGSPTGGVVAHLAIEVRSSAGSWVATQASAGARLPVRPRG